MSNNTVPLLALCPQVFQEYLELSKMAAMGLQEIQGSPESRAEWAEPGTRDLLASATHRPVRGQQQPGNPPTPKTIKHHFLWPEEARGGGLEEEA